jgi:N-glycosylase/DNA lyase
MTEISNGKIETANIKLPLKETEYIELQIDNGLTATEKIITELDRRNLKDKIVLMKLTGTLINGKTGDIRFNEIEDFVRKKQAYTFLRNISALKIQESEIEIKDTAGLDDIEKIEEKIIEQYADKTPNEFNKALTSLMNIMSIEKNEDEKTAIFEDRLISDLKKLLNLQEVI